MLLNRKVIFGGTLLLLALLGAAGGGLVRANGGSIEALRTVEGPYEIFVGAIPSPPVEGAVHLTVALTDAATAMPVTDATVEVFAQREGSEGGKRAQLFNSPASPEYYDRNVEVPQAGRWLFTLEVSSQLGDAVVEFSLEVQERRHSLAGRLTWIGTTSVVILGALYVWWTIRRTSRRRQSQL